MKLAIVKTTTTPLEMKKKTTPTTLMGKVETYQTTTTQGPPIYSRSFSNYIMSMALPENFKLPTTLKLYDGTRNPQVHVTMFNQ